MGRAKLEMQLVSKEKRHTTYKKRKEGILKKIHEFTTLCDVKACMIIFPPRQQASSRSPDQLPPPPPEIWPEENPGHVTDLINLYRATNNGGATNTTRNSGLVEFYHNRIKKSQEELEKTKKKRRELVYPTSTEPMNHLSEAELREIANKLEDKLVNMKCTIDSNKAYSNALVLQKNLEWDHQLQYFQQQEQNFHQNNQNQNQNHPQNQTFSFMEQLMSKNEDENRMFPASQFASLKSEFVHAPPAPVGMYGGGLSMPNYHAELNGQYLQMGYMQLPYPPPNHIVEQNVQTSRGMEFFQ